MYKNIPNLSRAREPPGFVHSVKENGQGHTLQVHKAPKRPASLMIVMIAPYYKEVFVDCRGKNVAKTFKDPKIYFLSYIDAWGGDYSKKDCCGGCNNHNSVAPTLQVQRVATTLHRAQNMDSTYCGIQKGTINKQAVSPKVVVWTKEISTQKLSSQWKQPRHVKMIMITKKLVTTKMVMTTKRLATPMMITVGGRVARPIMVAAARRVATIQLIAATKKGIRDWSRKLQFSWKTNYTHPAKKRQKGAHYQ